jgi:hypothetical protein
MRVPLAEQMKEVTEMAYKEVMEKLLQDCFYQS